MKVAGYTATEDTAIVAAVNEQLVPLSDLIARIRAAPIPPDVATRIIAVDGCGGSGKSTFAAYLSAALGACPTVHTDDFASWDHPLDWYPRVISELLEPIAANQRATFRRTDWVRGGPGDLVTIDPTPLLILEGVSASRSAFTRFLTFRIWIETAREVRLQRGIQRDGEAMRSQWIQWMDQEDRYVAEERPDQHADVIVSGKSETAYDSTQVFLAYTRSDGK
jgi:uridine kinase